MVEMEWQFMQEKILCRVMTMLYLFIKSLGTIAECIWQNVLMIYLWFMHLMVYKFYLQRKRRITQLVYLNYQQILKSSQ